jgi:hypothetical protein
MSAWGSRCCSTPFVSIKLPPPSGAQQKSDDRFTILLLFFTIISNAYFDRSKLDYNCPQPCNIVCLTAPARAACNPKVYLDNPIPPLAPRKPRKQSACEPSISLISLREIAHHRAHKYSRGCASCRRQGLLFQSRMRPLPIR